MTPQDPTPVETAGSDDTLPPELTVPFNLETVLRPISPEQPAGPPLGEVPLAQILDDETAAERELRKLREEHGFLPREARGDPGREATLGFRLKQWRTLRDHSLSALGESKDLRAALALIKALTYELSLPGVAVGLHVVRRLVERYWPTLHPLPHDPTGDRIMELRWIDSELQRLIVVAPFTSDDRSIGLQHFEAVRDPQKRPAAEASGWVSWDSLQSTVRGLEERPVLLVACAFAVKELERLATFVNTEVGAGTLEIADLVQSLRACEQALSGATEEASRAARTTGTTAGTAAGASSSQGAGDSLSRIRAAQAKVLARDGSTRRAQFMAQLELIEACVQAGLPLLAYALIEELSSLVQGNAILSDWEETQMLRRVWTALRDAAEATAPAKPAARGNVDLANQRLQALNDRDSSRPGF